jgi:hypothetical protein
LTGARCLARLHRPDILSLPTRCSHDPAAAVQGGNIDYGFFVIWNMLLLVVFAVGGTMVLRNVRGTGGERGRVGRRARWRKAGRSLTITRAALAAPPPRRALQIAYRTPLAVGFLIGSSFMMTQLMLQTAVISGAGVFAAKGSGLSATAAFASLILIFLVRAAVRRRLRRAGAEPAEQSTRGRSRMRVGTRLSRMPP